MSVLKFKKKKMNELVRVLGFREKINELVGVFEVHRKMNELERLLKFMEK